MQESLFNFLLASFPTRYTMGRASFMLSMSAGDTYRFRDDDTGYLFAGIPYTIASFDEEGIYTNVIPVLLRTRIRYEHLTRLTTPAGTLWTLPTMVGASGKPFENRTYLNGVLPLFS